MKKASVPMVVILFGKSKEVKFPHHLKASKPMTFTLLGIITDVNPVFVLFEKAPGPISITEYSIPLYSTDDGISATPVYP